MRAMKSLLAVWVLGAFLGCQGTSGGGSGAKVKVELAPNLQDYTVESVAILGFINTTGEDEADDMAEYLIRALYGTNKYHFVTAADFELDANRNEVGSEHGRLQSAWKKKGTMDDHMVRRVLEATGYDAVLGIEVTKWEELKLQFDQEGTSDTSVGVHVHMYGKDGTLLWSASHLKTEHSPPYLPSTNIRATATGEARTTAAGAVPDPPQIEKVALKVADEVAATLPRIGGEAAGGGESR